MKNLRDNLGLLSADVIDDLNRYEEYFEAKA